MSSPYRRRRPSLVRNFWIYRYLIASAIVLGLLLWFVLINNQPVTVFFPFGLGELSGRTGVLILLSAAVGAISTTLLGGVILAWRSLRSGGKTTETVDEDPLPDDRPPANYASKTTEGFGDAPWSKGP